jgi:hypothetical protein
VNAEEGFDALVPVLALLFEPPTQSFTLLLTRQFCNAGREVATVLTDDVHCAVILKPERNRQAIQV